MHSVSMQRYKEQARTHHSNGHQTVYVTCILQRVKLLISIFCANYEFSRWTMCKHQILCLRKLVMETIKLLRETYMQVWVYGWINDTQVTLHILWKPERSPVIWEKRWSSANVLSHGSSQIQICIVVILNYNTRIRDHPHGDSCSAIHFWELWFRRWVVKSHQNRDSFLNDAAYATLE